MIQFKFHNFDLFLIIFQSGILPFTFHENKLRLVTLKNLLKATQPESGEPDSKQVLITPSPTLLIPFLWKL